MISLIISIILIILLVALFVAQLFQLFIINSVQKRLDESKKRLDKILELNQIVK